MRIGLVWCTKAKLSWAAPGRDLYAPSALFRGRRSFVEQTCDKWFILSAFPDPLAISGLTDALLDIRAAQQHGNPDLRVLGVVLSGIDGRKTRLASSLIDYVEEKFSVAGGPSAKFKTTISRSPVVTEASKLGKTVFQTDPTHKVAQQYRALAQEIEERTGRIVPFVAPPPATTEVVPAPTNEREAVVNG